MIANDCVSTLKSTTTTMAAVVKWKCNAGLHPGARGEIQIRILTCFSHHHHRPWNMTHRRLCMAGNKDVFHAFITSSLFSTLTQQSTCTPIQARCDAKVRTRSSEETSAHGSTAESSKSPKSCRSVRPPHPPVFDDIVPLKWPFSCLPINLASNWKRRLALPRYIDVDCVNERRTSLEFQPKEFSIIRGGFIS